MEEPHFYNWSSRMTRTERFHFTQTWRSLSSVPLKRVGGADGVFFFGLLSFSVALRKFENSRSKGVAYVIMSLGPKLDFRQVHDESLDESLLWCHLMNHFYDVINCQIFCDDIMTICSWSRRIFHVRACPHLYFDWHYIYYTRLATFQRRVKI